MHNTAHNITYDDDDHENNKNSNMKAHTHITNEK